MSVDTRGGSLRACFIRQGPPRRRRPPQPSAPRGNLDGRGATERPWRVGQVRPAMTKAPFSVEWLAQSSSSQARNLREEGKGVEERQQQTPCADSQQTLKEATQRQRAAGGQIPSRGPGLAPGSARLLQRHNVDSCPADASAGTSVHPSLWVCCHGPKEGSWGDNCFKARAGRRGDCAEPASAGSPRKGKRRRTQKTEIEASLPPNLG